jgi:hypothetical protein
LGRPDRPKTFENLRKSPGILEHPGDPFSAGDPGGGRVARTGTGCPARTRRRSGAGATGSGGDGVARLGPTGGERRAHAARQAAQPPTGAERLADESGRARAGTDYFATSLPTMLLFHDDLEAMRDQRAAKLRELARAGLAQIGFDG